jgi:hypothetical protein
MKGRYSTSSKFQLEFDRHDYQETSMKNQFSLALAASALLLAAPGFAPAQEHSLEHVVVEMASTPAQHTALASHYVASAAAARKNQDGHEQMARAYAASGRGAPMRGHCERLAQKDGESAAEYDELAKFHTAESKRAQ